MSGDPTVKAMAALNAVRELIDAADTVLDDALDDLEGHDLEGHAPSGPPVAGGADTAIAASIADLRALGTALIEAFVHSEPPHAPSAAPPASMEPASVPAPSRPHPSGPVAPRVERLARAAMRAQGFDPDADAARWQLPHARREAIVFAAMWDSEHEAMAREAALP